MHGDLLLKVHVVLESAEGKVISEIKTDQVLRGVAGEVMLGSTLNTVMTWLEIAVISPIRGLIRAYVLRLEKELPYRRRDQSTEPLPWPADQTTLHEMDQRVMTLAREHTEPSS